MGNVPLSPRLPLFIPEGCKLLTKKKKKQKRGFGLRGSDYQLYCVTVQLAVLCRKKSVPSPLLWNC